ncbi:MAG: FkbM family methyltransferase [Halioglobus sp.]
MSSQTALEVLEFTRGKIMILTSKLKSILGYIPTRIINQILRSTRDRLIIARIAKMASEYPSFLGGVDTELFVPTQFGFSMYCDRKDVIGSSIIYEGQWEPLLSKTIAAYLREGDVAIDIGANMGYDTLLMSHIVGKGGLVIAFEPELNNLNRLLKNVLVNSCNNIVLQSVALSDVSGRSEILCPPEYNLGQANMRPSSDGRSLPILTARLDQVLNSTDFDRIKLLKMDVEGYEYKVLKGMGNLLDRVDSLTCEINHDFLKACGSSEKEIFDVLHAHGFSSYCAGFEEAGSWKSGDHAFEPKIKRAQGVAYDTLFVRGRPPELAELLECPSSAELRSAH